MIKFFYTIVTRNYYKSATKDSIKYANVPFRRDRWLLTRIKLALQGFKATQERKDILSDTPEN